MTDPNAAFRAWPARSADHRFDRMAPVERTAHWYPSSAVVFAGARGEGGPSVDICCSYLNFHTDRASAAAWAAAHPHIEGTILDQSSALALGQATFGPILTAPI